ncbi:MAG: HAMP domain-containing histidine kinase [Burkholderiaceae bacterium]|nr:HAMP domain-containing histidine kinase [Burkholderiaceae bacterium]
MAQRPKTLLGRMWLGLAATLLLVWLGLIAREVYGVLVEQRGSATAGNKFFARGSLSVASLHKDRPQELAQALIESERRGQLFWDELGYDPPAHRLVVSIDGKIVHDETKMSPDSVTRLGSHLAPTQSAHDRWLYADFASADGAVRVQRWEEVPGGWHFSIAGLSYYAKPLLFTLPLLLLPSWLTLRAGLRPLRSMGHDIARRPETDLSPLPPSPYAELSPVVDAANRLMQRLELRLNREREFLVDAAHELKTPLAVVQVNAESLLTAPNIERQQAARERLREGVQRVSHVVHQLLSLNRSQRELQAPDRQSHDLVALTRDRIGLLLALAKHRQIELELQSPEEAWMMMSRECMGSLIDNLVDNAIKYTPAGGQVLVRIAQDEAALEFSVSDNGPGIPPELRHQVFERFYRMPDQDQSGSGLGLSIVERTAGQYGGSVALATGLEGRGLSATVRFPRDQAT